MDAECENPRLLHCEECGRHTPRVGGVEDPKQCWRCGGKLEEHQVEGESAAVKG